MFKKKRPKFSIADVSPKMRAFILDSQIQHAHEISELLGCTPISDDVADKEEHESDKRVERIGYLVPLVYSYARILSEGTVEFQKLNLPEELEDLPQEIWIESRRMVEQVAFSATIGAISQLLDMGLLIIPKGKK